MLGRPGNGKKVLFRNNGVVSGWCGAPVPPLLTSAVSGESKTIGAATYSTYGPIKTVSHALRHYGM